ncbi:MAG: hypothetical protein PVF51_11530 [Nitrospirota bacterium]
MTALFRTILLVLVCAGATGVALAAEGEQAPTDEQLQAHMDAMSPMFGKMAQSMMQGRFAALAAPETTKQLARFARSYYDALIAEGFTKDQALQIVIAVGIPSAQ